MAAMMLSLTACGEETEQNIRENNEVQIGINLENKAEDVMEDINGGFQDAEDAMDIPTD